MQDEEHLRFPVLRPPYAEDHPLLSVILDKRREAAGTFTPEFSGQRFADFDRGLMCAFEAVNAALQNATRHQAERETLARMEPVAFQKGVDQWMDACFGETIKADKVERCDRFVEEALEFVQSVGYSAERAHALVDYVFNRDIGEVNQEVGGVMVTLAAACNTIGVDIASAAQTELARVWTKVDAIRAKQAAKPTGSALPIALPPARMGWRDIESAPKDGTTIDVWRDGIRETVYWGFPPHCCGEMGQYCDSDWHSIKQPGWVCATFGEFVGGKHDPFTHWMPLPPAPEAGQ